MLDANEPSVLADMMAVKIKGPAFVFLRPQHPMPAAALQSIAEAFQRARTGGDLADFAHVKFVVLPHGFDVMVMGDVELERAGLARLTASEAP